LIRHPRRRTPALLYAKVIEFLPLGRSARFDSIGGLAKLLGDAKLLFDFL